MTGDKGCKSNHVAHAQAACKLLKREAKKMKKIFNRVLAAAVAVPVAISQGLLFTNADEAASSTKLTTADFLTIEGCKTSSDWGVDVETAIVAAAGATGTIDFSAISAALPNQDNYYVGVLNNILADSGNATATVTADSKLTVTGSFDASSWVSDKLIPAVKDKLKEMGHDASDITVTLDAANLSGTYSASIDANDISTTKTFTNGEATIVTSDGTSYKYTDYAAYLQTVVDQLKASIAQQLAANDITLTAEEAAELDDLLTVRADNWTNKIENLLGKEGEKKYDSINDLLAAANKKNSHVPASLSEAAAYNAAADAAMSQINGIINQTDVAIDITAQDVIDVLSQGYNVVATADAEAGVYDLTFNIPDDQIDELTAALQEEQDKVDPTKAVVNVTSEKKVEVKATKDGTLFFDVTRTFTNDLIDKSLTTTTTAATTTTPAGGTTTTTPAGGTTTTTPAGGTTTTTPAGGTTTTTPAGGTTTTTPAGGTTTTTPAGGTTTTTPAVTKISVVETKTGYYFSEDTRTFDPTALLKVVSVDEKGNETDITADVTFGEDGAATPKSVYADTETYYVGTVDAYYKGVKLDAAPTVYIGVKGDADLNGKVELSDATLALTYYTEHSVNNAFYLTSGTKTPENAELETLAYFLADINTESTVGEDVVGTSTIELEDATNILTYYTEESVNNNPKWATICKSLADHPVWGAQIG